MNFDVIVIGGGHAGIEAALASARAGVSTAMLTMSLDSIGSMPCNPSIGGTAKGHLVFEIDALGGEMGYAADCVTMQSRTLNTGKGAAVRSKRIQADRRAYSALMKQILERTPNLRVIQAEAEKLIWEKTSDGRRRVTGVLASPGGEISAKAVVIASGTFLGGRTHIGSVQRESGPDGMLPARGLTGSLIDAGIRMMRFKTGTPPRIHRDSIDFDRLEVQYGEEYITPFSRRTDADQLNSIKQVPCHVVYTNAETHRIIRDNICHSPLYSGVIHGTGPRYCPSIEDKVVRFAEKERHQLFVEPMGEGNAEIYLQGFSSSMPDFVQEKMLHTLTGFENAEIMRYAYAIEYDCADPLQLRHTLEFHSIEGLFGAGQFNGSSGYEEAAAQGLIAGINAASKVLGRPELVLPRSSSYIGTLIDDLVTKGTVEPYRMMTSRSEFRLLLRQDNAEERLISYGVEAGLVSEERLRDFEERTSMRDRELARVKKTTVPPSAEVNEILTEAGSTPVSTGVKIAELIRRPEITYEMLSPIDKLRPELPREIGESVQTELKYEGYVKKQADEAQRQQKLEDKRLPADIDYKAITGLRLEAAEKLSKVRPENIGQASRISGVNPADITVLLIWLKSKK
ncbi:MAG: tRNA uridine-5-carboxymethylaminomethyl(34) synthesis enzyme MnmG [Ruminococcaceae bacterium]|nr:tRNA uridine-5-carboxymethylaminomethyl(34) synthesis enzyme MnmG [Oscillospiraceae bacterium]